MRPLTQRAMEPTKAAFGKAFWEGIINWDVLADSGTISDEDLELFRFVDTAAEAMNLIENWETSSRREELPGR